MMFSIFAFFAMVGLHEFYTIVSKEYELDLSYVLSMLGGLTLYALVSLWPSLSFSSNWFFTIGLAVLAIMLVELFSTKVKAALNFSVVMSGWVYVIFPFALINWLARTTGDFDYQLPVGFFAILWTNDTAAYLTGRSFGKHKLFPSVSPNKTWEGLLGGVLLATAAGAGIAYFFPVLPTSQWMIVAAIVASLGNVGDLFESHLKRTCQVKDSGTLIPGHGGVLDRFDGLLLAMPVVIFYLYTIYS
jgi:phosphatidate cytidylyltransferase